MLEVVALGVTGVLKPREDLWTAEITSARAWLTERGFSIPGFETAALAAYRGGEQAPLWRALRQSGLHLAIEARRALQCSVQRAVPPPAASLRSTVRSLVGDLRLVFLDAGDGRRMDAWIANLGLARLAERHVWTDDLGGEARPPSPLAFRWLQDRLGVSASRCLYVAGCPLLRRAALAAGWQVCPGADPSPRSCLDLESLSLGLESAQPTPEHVF
jgi:FMN phosphatase YigB (HAD superfamily)